MLELHGDEMERLISALGGEPGKKGRTRCFLHGGDNPTSFSYRPDGRWYCFAEGRGGDAVDLVVAARGCTAGEAMEFLASLGVQEALERKTPRDSKRARRIRRIQRDLTTIARHARVLLEGVTRAARQRRNHPAVLDAYQEVLRAFSRFEKSTQPEQLDRFIEFRGAVRAFFARLKLSPGQRAIVNLVLRDPRIYDAIVRLREETVIRHDRPQRPPAKIA